VQKRRKANKTLSLGAIHVYLQGKLYFQEIPILMPTQKTQPAPSSLTITGAKQPAQAGLLTPDALAFIAVLADQFQDRIDALLAARNARHARIDGGELPDFLKETAKIREDGSWSVGPIPHDLQDRRVEITGPIDRKMIINALNSGARVFMADCEDSHSPTWEGTIQGHQNLCDAVRRTIDFTSPEGKEYRLKEKTATLIVRPRGLHLPETHVRYGDKPLYGALFDFGLYFFHNAQALIAKNTGPYFYIPKLESHKEARLWNDIFSFAEDHFTLPRGTIKATVLIETILAAFEMEEILYELRDHIVGLNCGRWDYIFSFIKTFSRNPKWILPDRAQVTMATHFLSSYSKLLIKTCHKRGAFAMGGMSAYIPVRADEEANARAFANVRADKEREATNGHDGTWVAHPDLIPAAMEVFNRLMPTPNQLANKRDDVEVTASDLLTLPKGTITENGVRNNISVAIQYIEAWLQGRGAVPIFNLMEDAATAEISRSQLWQWVHYDNAKLDDGRAITPALYDQYLKEELRAIESTVGKERVASGKFKEASEILTTLVKAKECAEFLTLGALERLE
jgi:malate synthase